MFFKILGRAVAGSGLAFLGCLSCSHEGHEHPEAAHTEERELPTRSYTLFGDAAMLFLEHPVLVQGESARFLAHITLLADGSALTSGQVTLELGEQRLLSTTPKRAGLFVPEGAPLQAGRVSATLRVEGPALVQSWSLGEVEVYASRALAEKAPSSPAAEGVSFLLEQQWAVGVQLAPVQARALEQQRSLFATLEVREDARAWVSSTIGGRLVLAPEQSWPRLGDTVVAQQVLGWIEAPLSSTDQAQLQVWGLEASVRQLEASQQLEHARTQQSFAEQSLARVQAMRERGLSTQAELDAAHNTLAQARVALAGAERVFAELDPLPEMAARRLPLIAPIGGQITAMPVSLGQAVNPGEALVEIVDPTRLRLRAQLPEAQLADLSKITALEVTLALTPKERSTLALEHLRVGASLDQASRSLPLWIDLAAPNELWKPGVAAELRLRSAQRSATHVIPWEAVVPDQGLSTAYVQLSGENFERRILQLGARDGTHVEVLSGLVAGERVVTRGSHYVRLASMAPEGFGHGHAH